MCVCEERKKGREGQIGKKGKICASVSQHLTTTDGMSDFGHGRLKFRP